MLTETEAARGPEVPAPKTAYSQKEGSYAV
jgi:hypothetical protein